MLKIGGHPQNWRVDSSPRSIAATAASIRCETSAKRQSNSMQSVPSSRISHHPNAGAITGMRLVLTTGNLHPNFGRAQAIRQMLTPSPTADSFRIPFQKLGSRFLIYPNVVVSQWWKNIPLISFNLQILGSPHWHMAIDTILGQPPSQLPLHAAMFLLVTLEAPL